MVLILTRLLCAFGASLFTRVMSRFITVADPNPGWKLPLVSGWAGMRGVVSLAAALSVPILLQTGQPFPYRSLILFITFVVILATLFFQGLTLPWLIRKIKLEDKYSAISEEGQELIIQRKIAQGSLHYLHEKHGPELGQNALLNNLVPRLQIKLGFLQLNPEQVSTPNANSNFWRIHLELLEQQRAWLGQMNSHAEFDEDLSRKYLSLIDLEEYGLRANLPSEANPG